MIRTGNTHRLSNFLLWQLAYAEIFFEKKLWPDFKKNDYRKIINKFRLLKRNFGAIKSSLELKKRIITSIILLFFNSINVFF